MSRLCSALMLLLGVAWGWNIDPRQLDRWVLFINSALVVFPLPLAWLKWFWWRTNVFGEMTGTLGALPVGYTVWFGSDAIIPSGFRTWLHRSCGINLDGIVPAFGDLAAFPFWAGFAIIFGLGWIAILLATLLTRPESMTVLRKFYRDVRPIGFWRPVEAELPSSSANNQKVFAPGSNSMWVGCHVLFPDGTSPFRADGRTRLAGNRRGDSYPGDRRLFTRLLTRVADRQYGSRMANQGKQRASDRMLDCMPGNITF